MEETLTILWTNADPITAKLMVFMYAENALARGWWKKVKIIVWGATAKLITENKEVREKLLDIKLKGVKVEACIACANELGVSEELMAMGFLVKGMGAPLTEVIKSGGKLITV